jgi:NAD(P)-dependent dehydrogenase (short-subunit alcohol dehydrogenase family)
LTISSTLVTGANRGIGLGIAECCLVNGAEKIYSVDITQPGDEFQILSKRFPGRLFSATADVTREDSIQAAVDTIISEAGALHGMVVNAGRTNHKSALDFTQAEIEALFNVNVSYLLS